jgi:hypothetical protein
VVGHIGLGHCCNYHAVGVVPAIDVSGSPCRESEYESMHLVVVRLWGRLIVAVLGSRRVALVLLRLRIAVVRLRRTDSMLATVHEK